MLIILSVFLVLIICSGAASASSETNQTLTTEYNDEIVNVDDTDEKLTVEVSSAGSDDDSGLKELDSETREKELNKTNFIKKENNLLKASNDNQLLGNTIYVEGSTFADIQNAINRASAGDTIYLNSPLYTGSGKDISISKQLTIIGVNNCTLDAKQNSGIFYSYGNNINIFNITFINAKPKSSGYGSCGALYVSGNNNFIFNCTFINNAGTHSGSAISISGESTIVSNCTFIHNSANAYGSSIAISGKNNVITNSTFINHETKSIIYNSARDSNLTISNSIFKNNSKAIPGLIDYWNGNGLIYNCSFINNTNSYNSLIRVYYSNNVTINRLTVINNTAIYMLDISNSENVTISSTNFINVNKLTAHGLTGTLNNSKLILTFEGYTNYINALYEQSSSNVIFDNVTYWNSAIVNSDDVVPIKSKYHKFSNLFSEIGINITLEIYDSNNNLIDNITSMTDVNGQISYDYSHLPIGKYNYKAYNDNRFYTTVQSTGSFGVNNYNVIILNNNTNNVKQNQKTKITAKITDFNNATIKPEGTKLIFIHLKS